MNLTLSDSLREELKSPLGDLILEYSTNKDTIKKAITGKYVITVGDRTTEKMINFGLIPSLQIVDNQERRQKRKAPICDISEYLECENPAAEITQNSIDIIKSAFLLKPPVRITVSGEEDLLVIPVCIYAPENSIVLYGQPGEGLVLVQVTPKIRNKTQKMLNLINGV